MVENLLLLYTCTFIELFTASISLNNKIQFILTYYLSYGIYIFWIYEHEKNCQIASQITSQITLYKSHVKWRIFFQLLFSKNTIYLLICLKLFICEIIIYKTTNNMQLLEIEKENWKWHITQEFLLQHFFLCKKWTDEGNN